MGSYEHHFQDSISNLIPCYSWLHKQRLSLEQEMLTLAYEFLCSLILFPHNWISTPLLSVTALCLCVCEWVSVKNKDSLSETALAHVPLRETESITTVTNSVTPPWWWWATTASFTFTDTLTDISWHWGPVMNTCMVRPPYRFMYMYYLHMCMHRLSPQNIWV